MKEFFCSKKGNAVLGVVLTIIVFVILNIAFGLGGAIGGAIAGSIGFGGAAIIKIAMKPADKNVEKTDGNDTN